MICKKCGKENDEINTFCTSCGNPMKEEAITMKKLSAGKLRGTAVIIIVIAAVIVALYMLKGISPDLPGSNDSKGDVIHGAFCCQMNDVVYYIDSQQQLCSIHLDGTDNSVIFEGIVSNVRSNNISVYFNGEKDGAVSTYRYDPYAGELLRSEYAFDCFDVYEDSAVFGIVNNINPMDDMYNYENGNAAEGKTLMICDADLKTAAEVPIYGIGAIKNICIDYTIYMTDSNGKIYSGQLHPYVSMMKISPERISDNTLNCEEIVTDAQSTKACTVSGSLYYNDMTDNSLKIYRRLNGDSKIQTAARGLASLDFALNENWIVYCNNGIRAKSDEQELLIADCSAEKIGMSGETVYFTRSEDGVLCRASVDGKGVEEVRTQSKLSKPEVRTLYDDGIHYGNYYRLPYISGADNEILNDFNKFMFEKKADMQLRSTYYYDDVMGWSDARYTALADDNNIQIVFYYNTYGEHIFRTYNYNVSTGTLESFDSAEGLVNKTEAAMLINEYIDKNNSSGELHSISASDISVSGYVDDANGNKLIYLRCNSGLVWNDAEIHVYDTANGNLVVNADKDDIFNAFLDSERFPNAVEPLKYDSGSDE